MINMVRRQPSLSETIRRDNWDACRAFFSPTYLQWKRPAVEPQHGACCAWSLSEPCLIAISCCLFRFCKWIKPLVWTVNMTLSYFYAHRLCLYVCLQRGGLVRWLPPIDAATRTASRSVRRRSSAPVYLGKWPGRRAINPPVWMVRMSSVHLILKTLLVGEMTLRFYFSVCEYAISATYVVKHRISGTYKNHLSKLQ